MNATSTNLNSCLYSGEVGHFRHTPVKHSFYYKIFLFCLDLDELDKLPNLGFWFKVNRPALMSFRTQDYLYRDGKLTRETVWQKVHELGGTNQQGKVLFVGQVRCLGVYFSPVNFYYCHDEQGKLRYLLAEVSNTPWNERHYYLVDAKHQAPMDKQFHVSPFMNLDMQYHWRFSALTEKLQLHISNQKSGQTLFDATLQMERKPLTKQSLRTQWLRIPAMTLKTVAAIYWQAAKLYWKKVPYVPYARPTQESSP